MSQIEEMYSRIMNARAAVTEAWSLRETRSFQEWMEDKYPHFWDDTGTGGTYMNSGLYATHDEARQALWDNVLGGIYAEWEKAVQDSEDWIAIAEKALQAEYDRIHNIVMAEGTHRFGEVRSEFIQNIYSTKPLTTVEIYRMTNNALAKFVGGVKNDPRVRS